MEPIQMLTTEQVNERTRDLDRLDALAIVTLMNEEDGKVATAVSQILPQIARAVDVIVEALEAGRRLIYIGAGTSGRLGVLDASECPPTFGIDPAVVIALIAGGESAMFHAAEGAEDDERAGETDLLRAGLSCGDVVVGISASGRTPYVAGALRLARVTGCQTVAVCCNKGSLLGGMADIPLEVDTGPEVLGGSTRLKAGTAQKMILNALSTAAMVRMGKVYGNLMVDMVPSNAKLVERACRILMKAASVDREQALLLLQMAGNRTKVALVMARTGLSLTEAERRLRESGGHVRAAVKESTG